MLSPASPVSANTVFDTIGAHGITRWEPFRELEMMTALRPITISRGSSHVTVVGGLRKPAQMLTYAGGLFPRGCFDSISLAAFQPPQDDSVLPVKLHWSEIRPGMVMLGSLNKHAHIVVTDLAYPSGNADDDYLIPTELGIFANSGASESAPAIWVDLNSAVTW